MADDLRKLMQPWMRPGTESYRQTCWQPPADIYRMTDGWLVKFDLAGVRPEEIELEVRGCHLTIRGSRHDWMIHETQNAYSMEIAYNRFERSLRLPCEADLAEVTSEYRDGMLLIRLKLERQ